MRSNRRACCNHEPVNLFLPRYKLLNRVNWPSSEGILPELQHNNVTINDSSKYWPDPQSTLVQSPNSATRSTTAHGTNRSTDCALGSKKLNVRHRRVDVGWILQQTKTNILEFVTLTITQRPHKHYRLANNVGAREDCNHYQHEPVRAL